jgi:hypothetical protein
MWMARKGSKLASVGYAFFILNPEEPYFVE